MKWDVAAARVLAVALLSRVPAIAAQQAGPSVGTVIVAHGADSTWNADVLTLAQQVHTGGPIAVAFLMGPAAAAYRFQDAVAHVAVPGVQKVVIVPLLVSSHSEHYDEIRWLAGTLDTVATEMRQHLAMAGIERPHVSVPLVVTPAMDDSPEVAHVLAARVRALTHAPKRHAIFLVGHGPNSDLDYVAWMQNLRAIADSVQRETGSLSVKADVVRDDAPAPVRAEAVQHIRDIIGLQIAATHQSVVVAPILVAHGPIADEKFRHDLAGLQVIYAAEPLLPDSAMVHWVERRVRTAASGS